MIPKRIRAWLSERRRKRAIYNIRAELYNWGFDISDLTDEEIEESVTAMSKQLARTGITCEQACNAFRNIQIQIQTDE